MKRSVFLGLCLLFFNSIVSAQVTLIPFNDTWKYLDNGTNQGTAWRNPGFDDVAWKSGIGKLGYGTDNISTIVDYGGHSNNKYITTYFRKTVNITDPAAYAFLTAFVRRDDGLVVYVNGTEVYRNNMGTGTIGFDSVATVGASDDGNATLFFNINSALFVAGDNMIAAEVHQQKANSSDLAFDLKLTTPDNSTPSLLSSVRQNPLTELSSSAAVTFRLTFSEPVNGVSRSDFSLTTTGTATGSFATNAVKPADIDGAVYDVTVSSITGSGTLRLNLKATNTGITDLVGNPIPSVAFTSGQSYTIDRLSPTLVSIHRLLPLVENTASETLTWQLEFSEHVTGVDLTDFILTTLNGTASADLTSGAVVPAGASGTLYNLTINNVTGAGVLRLDQKNTATIHDVGGNALTGVFASGETFNIDRVAPELLSFNRQQPLNEISNAGFVVYRLTFSEPVTGVDVSDFSISPGGTAQGALAADALIAAGDGIHYDLTVSGLAGEGTLQAQLHLAASGIADVMENPVAGATAGSQQFTIDRVAPTVVINRQVPATELTNAGSVTFRVIFSEAVGNVGASSFHIHTEGAVGGMLAADAVSEVTMDGTTYDVTINAVTGEGLLRLDIFNGVSITDQAGNVVANVTAGPGYQVDRVPPAVQSINRLLPLAQTTSLRSVTWRISFSEPLTAPAASDFILYSEGGTVSGILNENIVSAGNNAFDVTVHSLAGAGPLRLDLKESIALTDVAGNIYSGPYTSGQNYIIEDDIPPTVVGISRQLPLEENTNAGSLVFRISFSEPVTGLDVTDLTLSGSGTASGILGSGAVLQMDEDGAIYHITVTGVTGVGDLSVEVNNQGTGIIDLLGNPLPGGFTSGALYKVDDQAPSVISIQRQNPAVEFTTASSLTWRVTFSEPVTKLNAMQFTLLAVNGTIIGEPDALSVAPAEATGTVYDITLRGHSGAGTLRLDLQATGSLTDAAGNFVASAFTTGETFSITDVTPPVVLAVERMDPENTAAASIRWRIRFSEPVTGLDLSDLVLQQTEGSATGSFAPGAITTMDADGAEYLVTLQDISGLGHLRLDVAAEGSGITDLENNLLNGGFTSGETYAVDRLTPQVLSVSRLLPQAERTAALSVSFEMVFSEPVTGVDLSDLVVITDGDATGVVHSVTADASGTTYTINVSEVAGNGMLRVNLKGSGTGIADILGNSITSGFTSGSFYTIDQLPFIISSNRLLPLTELTSAAQLGFRVVFSEPVSGVDNNDFILAGTGTASGLIQSVNTTDGIAYDVTVSNVDGLGTLRLDAAAAASITDAYANMMNTVFTGGQAYSVDRVLPVVNSLNRQVPATETTNAASITWRIVFSEPVTGVNVSDFTLLATGSAAGVLGAVSAADAQGASFDITVHTITGTGTLKLDLKSTGTGINDPAGNMLTGGYAGQTYKTDRVAPVVNSINRWFPTTSTTSETAVTFRITFSEAVSGVNEPDFMITTTSGAITAEIETGAVTQISPTVFDLVVSSVNGTGTFRLDLRSTGTGISDVAGNNIAGGFTSGQTYTIDQSPIVVSINRQLPLTATASDASVTYRVTFSKKVSGVDVEDFILRPLSGNVRGTFALLANEPSGTVATEALKPVGTDGNVYDVTVRALAGSGLLRLDLLASGTGITDVQGNSLQGGFSNGQAYDIQPSAGGFVSFSDINPLPISSHTGEKPQAKLWKYAGQWWSVLATTGGTKIFRLDGRTWTETLKLTTHTSTKNDCIVLGNVTHILTFRTGSNESYIVSVEYDPLSNTYIPWNKRKTKVALMLGSAAETATLAVDGNGRMWVVNDVTTDIVARWSDAPYTTWSSAITIASGITSDDISTVVAMPGKIGILWSNQNTKRFGFKTHTNGASPASWSADENPASQSARSLGNGFSDDHMNITCGSDGTVYVAAKTGYDLPGNEKIIMLVRRPAGTWDNVYAVTANEGTRPIILLNEASGKVKIVYTTHENGGDILYREASTSAISFGRPYTIIGGNPALVYNYATATHQLYNPDVVILATDIRSGTSDLAVSVIASDAAAPALTKGRPEETIQQQTDQLITAEETQTMLALPNPFTQSTRLQFTMPETGVYTVTLYDELGRRAGFEHRGWAQKAVVQQVPLNGSQLKPGVYYVTVRMAGSQKSIRLLRL